MTRDETVAFLLKFGAEIYRTADLPLDVRGPIIQKMLDEMTDEQKLFTVQMFQAAGVVPKVRPTPAPAPTPAPEGKAKHQHKRRGGNRDRWDRLEIAKRVLEKHHSPEGPNDGS